MTEPFWLGPTYEFRSEDWVLIAGIHGESGRLEWLLRRVENGVETVSRSFALEQHAGPAELEAVLDDLPPEIREELVSQAAGQTDPQLLSGETESGGLA